MRRWPAGRRRHRRRRARTTRFSCGVDIVMAYIARTTRFSCGLDIMAYIVMAYIARTTCFSCGLDIMAYIVMAHIARTTRFARSTADDENGRGVDGSTGGSGIGKKAFSTGDASIGGPELFTGRSAPNALGRPPAGAAGEGRI